MNHPRCYNENMSKQALPGGTIHVLPNDLRKILLANKNMLSQWRDITPLARNEFICWIENAKKPQTRARRIEVTKDKLVRGERRPCCWIGCTHRLDKQISPSVRGILEKRSPNAA